ncbi:MAG: NUDIX hydrolase [Bacteroidia bacterium]|jgi:ADP-ribose pyrophosphatase YjhB (NUDIX family)|nr:NUDIX hydrolase [Bacteroidia bacterium]
MKRINLRAYAIIEHEGNVLVTDELRMNKYMTKFPGGGHEWGEGLEETVRRECREELNQEPASVTHFYTTDFFVASAFSPDDQLVSVYYLVSLPSPESIAVVQTRFEFTAHTDGEQTFRWIKRSELTPDIFTYPIDQQVAALLRG